MVSASHIQTLLMCAKAQESHLMLPDGFSIEFSVGHKTRCSGMFGRRVWYVKVVNSL